MRHVDEGILNAYLDGELDSLGAGRGERGAETQREKGKGKGERFSSSQIEAHVSECEQCAALLQDVERVRDAASCILASSTPAGLEVPPFEEIRARAEVRGRSQRVVRMGKVRKLAWAATVVLAVAVGWYARGTVIPGTSERFSAAELAEVASAPEEGTGSGERGAEADVATIAANALEQEGAPAARRLRQQAEEDASALVALAETQETAAPPAAKTTVVEPSSPTNPVPVVRADEIVDVSRERKGLAEPADRRAPEAPSVAVQQVTADEPAARVGGIAVGEVLPSDSLWLEASESEARDVIGGDVPTIPGLPVIDHSVSVMPGSKLVRVRQRLDDDEIIELVVAQAISPDRMQVAVGVRSEVAANEPRDADEATLNTVTLQVGDYQVTLRGAVSRDSLRVLGGKVGR